MKASARRRWDVLFLALLGVLVVVLFAWLKLTPKEPRFLWSRNPQLHGRSEAVGRQGVTIYWVKADFERLVQDARQELGAPSASVTNAWREAQFGASVTFSKGLVATERPFFEEDNLLYVPRGTDESITIVPGKLTVRALDQNGVVDSAPGYCSVIMAKDLKQRGLTARLREWIRSRFGV